MDRYTNTHKHAHIHIHNYPSSTWLVYLLARRVGTVERDMKEQ